MLLLNVALAVMAVIWRDRALFITYALVSLCTGIGLLFLSPIFGVLKLAAWFITLRYCISLYNVLITLANAIDLALGGIRVALTRRQHILPRMERYVANYARHEQTTFRQTVQARGGGARNLLALVESYPALRASQTFQALLAELVDAENQVYARRIAFNEGIRAFNTELGRFPNVILGRAMGFATRSYETVEQNL
jgi:LemA protein